MHSSTMRTVRNSSRLLGGGGGCLVPGGRGCLVRRVPGQGVPARGRVPVPGGMVSQHALLRQTDRQV